MLNNQRGNAGIILIVVLVVLVVIFFMFGYPWLNVWQQEMHGKAELKRAEGNRQILIQEAEAKKHAATALADAEVARARGVAEANKIIGDSLKDNENYLRYLWIHNLEEGGNQIIYVATEAGLPIMEAGKRPDKKQ